MKFLYRLRLIWTSEAPALIVITNLFASALALASAPIVARAIGPEGRGETAVGIAAFGLVPIVLALGVPLEARRSSAQGVGDEVVRAARRLWAIWLIPSAFVAAALGLSLFASFSPADRMVAIIGVALSPLVMSWTTDMNVLVAKGRFRAVAGMRIGQPFIYVAIVALGWFAGIADVAYILAANVVATVGVAILGRIFVRLSRSGPRLSTRQLLGRGANFAGSATAEGATGYLPLMLALPLIGSAESGLFAVSVAFGMIPLAFAHAIAARSFREIAAAEDVEEAHELVIVALRTATAIGLMVCGGLATAVPILIPLVFGAAFAGAVPLALVSLAGGVAMLASYVASMALAAKGRGRRMTFAQSIALGWSVAWMIVLGPAMGAMGIALAVASSYAVLLCILTQFLGVRPWKLVPRPSDFALGISRLFR